jgi:hypothetical protein
MNYLYFNYSDANVQFQALVQLNDVISFFTRIIAQNVKKSCVNNGSHPSIRKRSSVTFQ